MKKKNLLLIAVASIGLTAATVAQTVPSYVPTNGLVGWWPFNGNAIDESINTNDGTVNGATLTTDRFGNANKAYSFDGLDDYISTTFLGVSGNNPRTISFWLRTIPSALSCGGYAISYGTQSPTNAFIIDVSCSNGGSFGVSPSDASAGVNNISNFCNQWHLCTIVNPLNSLSVQDLRLFIDGVQLNNISYYNPTFSVNTILSNPVTIGRNFYSDGCGYNYYEGKLDDIGIWNRALTQQEITALYNGANVGINDFSIENQFSIFPNPAQNVITVKATTKLDGSVYSIYDNIGRVVASGKLNGEITMVELGHLAAGIYTLRVGDNLKQTFKIVKE